MTWCCPLRVRCVAPLHWDDLTWISWRRRAAEVLLRAWRFDVACPAEHPRSRDLSAAILSSDCVPDRGVAARFGRVELRRIACEILAQSYGDGANDELAARWRSLWSEWLAAEPTTEPERVRYFRGLRFNVLRVLLGLGPWTLVRPSLDDLVQLQREAGEVLSSLVELWLAEGAATADAERLAYRACAELLTVDDGDARAFLRCVGL